MRFRAMYTAIKPGGHRDQEDTLIEADTVADAVTRLATGPITVDMGTVRIFHTAQSDGTSRQVYPAGPENPTTGADTPADTFDPYTAAIRLVASQKDTDGLVVANSVEAGDIVWARVHGAYRRGIVVSARRVNATVVCTTPSAIRKSEQYHAWLNSDGPATQAAETARLWANNWDHFTTTSATYPQAARDQFVTDHPDRDAFAAAAGEKTAATFEAERVKSTPTYWVNFTNKVVKLAELYVTPENQRPAEDLSRYPVDAEIRAQQDRYQQDRAGSRCLLEMCDHDHPADPLPPGVQVATDYRRRIVLIRYRRRGPGGWYVVRADNGRTLGWIAQEEFGHRKGDWATYVSSDAFLGDGPDGRGDLLDRVPGHLYNGEGICSRAIDYSDNRHSAASSLIWHLEQQSAPALVPGRHSQVRVYRTRPAQHYQMVEGPAARCACDRPWPCPERAEMENAGR